MLCHLTFKPNNLHEKSSRRSYICQKCLIFQYFSETNHKLIEVANLNDTIINLLLINLRFPPYF